MLTIYVYVERYVFCFLEHSPGVSSEDTLCDGGGRRIVAVGDGAKVAPWHWQASVTASLRPASELPLTCPDHRD